MKNDAQEYSTPTPLTGAALRLRYDTFLRFGNSPPQILQPEYEEIQKK